MALQLVATACGQPSAKPRVLAETPPAAVQSAPEEKDDWSPPTSLRELVDLEVSTAGLAAELVGDGDRSVAPNYERWEDAAALPGTYGNKQELQRTDGIAQVSLASAGDLPCRVQYFEDTYFGGSAPIVTRRIEYAATGRPARIEDDVATDGKIDRVRTWSYGRDGLLESETTVDHHDGTCRPRGAKRLPNIATTVRFGYDRYSMHTSTVVSAEPADGEPTTEYLRAIVYDDAGFPTRLQFQGRTTTFVWDERGQLRQRNSMSVSDGTPASFWYDEQERLRWAALAGETTRYDYDRHGRPIGGETRRDADNATVRVHRIDYDDQGRQVSEVHREFLTKFRSERWVEHSVDGRSVAEAQGELTPRLAGRLRALDHAELLDRRVHYRLQRFDSLDRLVMEIEGGQSEASEYRASWHADGRRLEWSRRSLSKPMNSERVVVLETSGLEEFDMRGRSVRRIVDRAGVERRTEYSYACDEAYPRHKPLRVRRCTEEYTGESADEACQEHKDRCDTAIHHVEGWR